jgi:hypothetical protein
VVVLLRLAGEAVRDPERLPADLRQRLRSPLDLLRRVQQFGPEQVERGQRIARLDLAELAREPERQQVEPGCRSRGELVERGQHGRS